MATIFTHAFVGSSLSTCNKDKKLRLRLAWVLATLSILPDLDVISFRLGIAYSDPLGHRGLSHSIVFAVVLALIASLLFRPKKKILSKAWFKLYTLCFIALISHGLLDALTNGGLGVGFFIPFDNSRYFLPWQPLEVSPISIQNFLSPWGLEVILNEALWIWLPVIIFLIVLKLIRLSKKQAT
ncbi:MAG: metal-dependent hydrolase [Deltaproteobacteria bacterium]|nr:metal-dependent hydrolase [Deltaproteobacteria bacterium]